MFKKGAFSLCIILLSWLPGFEMANSSTTIFNATTTSLLTTDWSAKQLALSTSRVISTKMPILTSSGTFETPTTSTPILTSSGTFETPTTSTLSQTSNVTDDVEYRSSTPSIKTTNMISNQTSLTKTISSTPSSGKNGDAIQACKDAISQPTRKVTVYIIIISIEGGVILALIISFAFYVIRNRPKKGRHVSGFDQPEAMLQSCRTTSTSLHIYDVPSQVDDNFAEQLKAAVRASDVYLSPIEVTS